MAFCFLCITLDAFGNACLMNEKIRLSEAYLKAFQGLNQEQREAVETTQGPVAVFAGPGTGKTQIIATRIAYLLASPHTQASPHHILCLTFTDAGAVAMRERLLSLIGAEAHKVHIHTFHSFCNQVISRSPEYFGFRELKPLSEIERIELFQDLIKGIKPGTPLYSTAQDKSYLLHGLGSFFNLIKQENLNPSVIKEESLAEIEFNKSSEDFYYKRNGPGYKKGDFNEKKFKDAERRLLKTAQATDLFEQYNLLMAERQRFDFQDMISWVIRAFQEHEPLLLRYKEQYLYMLVDEYQDSNGSQLELLRLLSEDPDEQPNLFVVGDGDQAIYRFQGAEADNLLNFERQYQKHLRKIVLKENYRSIPAVLKASHQLIVRQNPSRVMALKAANPELAASNRLIDEIVCSNPIHEWQYILDQVQKKISESVPYSQLAIIYRNHKQADQLIHQLKHLNIPFETARPMNILELPMIKQLIHLMRYAAEEMRGTGYGDYLLFEMMHFDCFAIHPADAARFSRICDRGFDDDRGTPWREMLSSPERMLQAGLGSLGAFKKLNHMLNAMMKSLANDTLQEYFAVVLKESGMLSQVMNHPDRSWFMEVINTFFDFIKEETARKPETSLNGLLFLLDQMLINNVSLIAHQIYHAEDGLQLLTAHSAKGLEFDHVYLMGAQKNMWEEKRSPGRFITLPLVLQALRDDMQEEEERRLFYVAMTRARRSLSISYSRQDMKGKELEASRFVAEANDPEGFLKEKVISMADSSLDQFNLNALSPVPLTNKPWLDHTLINAALKGYRMSVTHLNKYLRCPVSFYFENILRVPAARSAVMGYGSAIHYALEMYYADRLKTDRFPEEEQLIRYFDKSMRFYRSHFTDHSFESYRERGHFALQKFRELHVLNSNTVVILEYKSNHLAIDGVPVSGRLDKLEFDGNDVTVVDYKTGRLSEEKFLPPGEKQVDGGDYWRQMIFYKLLLEADRSKAWKMRTGRFDFVEPDKDGKLNSREVPLLPEYEQQVKQQIQTVYQGIIAHEFSQGCEEEDCPWCSFVASRYQNLPEWHTEDEIDVN